jgi:hypothetical protein
MNDWTKRRDPSKTYFDACCYALHQAKSSEYDIFTGEVDDEEVTFNNLKDLVYAIDSCLEVIEHPEQKSCWYNPDLLNKIRNAKSLADC